MTLPTKGGTIDFVANNVGIEGDAEGILAMLRSNVEDAQDHRRRPKSTRW